MKAIEENSGRVDEQAAGKQNLPSGAKAPLGKSEVTDGLKPVPFKDAKLSYTGTIPPQSAQPIPFKGTTGSVSLDWGQGGMRGAPVQESTKTLGELQGVFLDEAAQARMDANQEVYRVRWWSPVEKGDEGGLFWGVTILQPGKVGDEYFMTHGHFHADRTRAEYYTTVSGKGMLVRMDEQRESWAEDMARGTLHYIRGLHAHRVVNVGNEPLIFWACWGSDAGYDYATIRKSGFGIRVLERGGSPAIVSHE